ncbi:MAG: PQQ-binding-like beta-propeller repeat protein [Candidatus Sumerlaeota bacterium]
MSTKRKIALALAVVFGIYVAVATGLLFIYYQMDIRRYYIENADTRQVLYPLMRNLKQKVAEKPEDEALIQQLREADYRLREMYFAHKPRYAWGAVTIILALAAMIASLRAFFHFAPRPGLSVLEPGHQPGARTRKERKAAIKDLYIFGSVLALLLIVIGLTASPEPAPEAYGEKQTTLHPDATPLPEEPSLFEENWPAFRGPGNIGHATGAGPWPKEWELPTDPETEATNIAWSVPCALEGKSSPIVWGDHIFVTGGTATEISVACFDRETGEQLWQKAVENARGTSDFEPYPDTGFAAPTPTTDGERVYSMWGNGVLAAFDFEGNQVWMRNFGVPDSMYSFSSSPIYHDGLVLLQFDQGMSEMDEKSSLMAFDPATGETKYEVPRPVANAWSSPSIINMAGRNVLLTTSMPWVIAYNPKTGEEYWRFEGMYGDVGPSPAANDKYYYVTNDGADLFAIKPGGSGDVTESHKAWSAFDGLPDTSSPVATEDYVLQVAAGGFLTCYKATSEDQEGELLWEEFLPESATASPILADGLVYLFADNGNCYIIELGDEYKPIAVNPLNLRVTATPAFADERIYVRSSKRLVCIENPAIVTNPGEEAPAQTPGEAEQETNDSAEESAEGTEE